MSNFDHEHLILIGFKHAGKSTIGCKLASQLTRPFIDLDREIECHFFAENQEELSVRDIMLQKGEDFFRQLEQRTLATVLSRDPAIIALGGGTPLAIENQALLKEKILIHIQAHPEWVFERIMKNGQPAFFKQDVDPIHSFNPKNGS